MDNPLTFHWSTWLVESQPPTDSDELVMGELQMPPWLEFEGLERTPSLLRSVSAVLEAIVTELVPEWPVAVYDLAEQVMGTREAPLAALITLAAGLEAAEDRTTVAGMLRLVGCVERAMETGQLEPV